MMSNESKEAAAAETVAYHESVRQRVQNEQAALTADSSRWRVQLAAKQAERDAITKKRQDDLDAQHKAEKDKRDAAEAARIRSELHAGWAGDEKSFAAAYPELLKAYQIQKSLRNIDERRAEVQKWLRAAM